jgi:hypothetical protein
MLQPIGGRVGCQKTNRAESFRIRLARHRQVLTASITTSADKIR